MKTIPITYCFTLADRTQEVFRFQLDAKSFDLFISTPTTLPAWTALSFHQCPNCLLTLESHPYCPLAANIVNIVMRFQHLLSYDEIYMEVVTEDRIVSQHTTAQRGVSSMMGLLIANSGCPHTAFFKPMARFHLPLANPEETLYRAASMYLLAQYFLKQEGKKAELELDGLKRIYDNIHIVNITMAERLREATESDLSANAVILLDLYALAFPYTIEKTLKNLRNLFAPFLLAGMTYFKEDKGEYDP